MTCGECGLFCSCGALWPSGMCLPRGEVLIEATDAACVCWEKDWRGVDQSDGVADPPSQRDALASEGKGNENENVEHPTSNAKHRTKGIDGFHGEGALGTADPFGAHDVREPQFPRASRFLSRPRFKQPQLF